MSRVLFRVNAAISEEHLGQFFCEPETAPKKIKSTLKEKTKKFLYQIQQKIVHLCHL